MKFGPIGQEKVVLVLFLICFAVFSLTLDGFLSVGNVSTLVRSVAVLGVLGIGMALVVIGRGIDLSIVATMAISVSVTLQLSQIGETALTSVLAGLATAAVIGAINGWLIAYAEIPPLFATLAMASIVYGFGRFAVVDQDIVYAPATYTTLLALGGIGPLGIPWPVWLFAAVALLAILALGRTRLGRFVYLSGDNPSAARITGIPTRPLTVLQYLITSCIAFVAGLITAASVGSMNTRVVNSTLVYDVILVVVLGGITLSGGRGSVRNVLVGTLLIGTLLNGMTIMNLQYTTQNLIKSGILLLAIIIDSFVNPRDEQTAQQGDI
jgi:ribose transport system permease protein